MACSALIMCTSHTLEENIQQSQLRGHRLSTVDIGVHRFDSFEAQKFNQTAAESDSTHHPEYLVERCKCMSYGWRFAPGAICDVQTYHAVRGSKHHWRHGLTHGVTCSVHEYSRHTDLATVTAVLPDF